VFGNDTFGLYIQMSEIKLLDFEQIFESGWKYGHY